MAASMMQVQKAPQQQDGAIVTMNNQTSRLMTLDRSFHWSGVAIALGYTLPRKIQANGSAKFTHLGRHGNSGSKAVVIYNGFADNGNVPIAWVFAFHVPKDPTVSPNKVFHTKGPKSVIDRMSFDEIQAALDNSDSADNACIESVPKNFVNIVANFGLN